MRMHLLFPVLFLDCFHCCMEEYASIFSTCHATLICLASEMLHKDWKNWNCRTEKCIFFPWEICDNWLMRVDLYNTPPCLEVGLIKTLVEGWQIAQKMIIFIIFYSMFWDKVFQSIEYQNKHFITFIANVQQNVHIMQLLFEIESLLVPYFLLILKSLLRDE